VIPHRLRPTHGTPRVEVSNGTALRGVRNV
jgi:hypothetical protein